MSEFSRVKKYEKIRESIENDRNSSTNISDTLKEYNNNLNNRKETYTPSHEKNFTDTNFNGTMSDTNAFKNEYLDSFIQEVREYNIQKGVREYEDTKLDILQQLSTKNREKRANYIEKIEENNDIEVTPLRDRSSETVEISKQVFELLNDVENNLENELDEDIEEIVEPLNETPPIVDFTMKEDIPIEKGTSLEERISQLEKTVPSNKTDIQENIALGSEDTSEEEISAITKEELLNQTMQLKVKMDKYEENLSDINTGVDKNNRLLNIVITVLILSLLAVILVVVYWLVSGGII